MIRIRKAETGEQLVIYKKGAKHTAEYCCLADMLRDFRFSAMATARLLFGNVHAGIEVTYDTEEDAEVAIDDFFSALSLGQAVRDHSGGMDYRDIAEYMGISYAAARQVVVRALEKLRGANAPADLVQVAAALSRRGGMVVESVRCAVGGL